jgi:hypothetical protein
MVNTSTKSKHGSEEEYIQAFNGKIKSNEDTRENINRMNLREAGLEGGMDWIYLAWDIDY